MQKLFVDPSYADTKAHRPPTPRLQPARGQQARAAQDLRLAIWPSDRRASDDLIAGARDAHTIGDGDGDGDRRWRSASGDRRSAMAIGNRLWAVWAMPKQSPACALRLLIERAIALSIAKSTGKSAYVGNCVRDCMRGARFGSFGSFVFKSLSAPYTPTYTF